MYFPKRRKIKIDTNPRARIIFGVFFLLCLGVVYKLFVLQVRDRDIYLARAESQQGVESTLLPLRGKIFLQDQSGQNGLYMAAVNKDFATLYTVPVHVLKASDTASVLYDVFKKDKVLKEVEDFFAKQDKDDLDKELSEISKLALEDQTDEMRAKVIAEFNAKISDQAFFESRKLAKDKMIEEKKARFLTNYMNALTKPNDPYEPLENKVDIDVLKDLYLRLIPITKIENIFNLTEKEKKTIDLQDLVNKIVKEKMEVRNNKMLIEFSNGVKKSINLDGVGFSTVPFRYYPEKNIGSHVLGFVGYSGETAIGRYGLEGFFNDELSGLAGMIKGDKDARGRVMAFDGMEYKKAQDGSDVVLTIDRAVEFFVCKKLEEVASRRRADGGSIIIMDPKTGAIVTMCSWPDYDPNNYKEVDDIAVYNNSAIFAQYEPGSVFKTITAASALDTESITPQTTYLDKGVEKIGRYKIHNSDFKTHGGHGLVDMTTMLELSLNTGAMFAMRKMGPVAFREHVKKFGFGEKTGIEFESEAKGDISSLEKKGEIYPATASFGQGISATPIQLVTAYSVLANKGVMMKPYLVKEIRHSDGSVEKIEPREVRRVISEKAAALTSAMLADVVEKGHSTNAQIKGYYIGGKTGTAQVASGRGYGTATIHTFIGYAPIEDPKYVLLVKIDNPKDAVWADQSAVPLFKEISEFLLKYWEIQPTRK